MSEATVWPNAFCVPVPLDDSGGVSDFWDLVRIRRAKWLNILNSTTQSGFIRKRRN